MKTKKDLRAQKNLRLILVFSAISVLVIMCNVTGNANSNVPSDKAGQAIPPASITAPDSIFQKVDQMPLFPGGDQGLLSFIAKNTKYPEDAKKAGTQGKVLVKFVVEKDCSISHVAIDKGVSPSIDAEALRVVKTLPKFEKPGINAGKKVSVYYIVPIQFSLK